MYIPCTALQNEDAESHLQTQFLWNIPYEQTKNSYIYGTNPSENKNSVNNSNNNNNYNNKLYLSRIKEQ